MDGCVLVTDAGAGSVTKYLTDGNESVVWRCDQLELTMELDVDEWGLIYVRGNSAIYLLSPKGQYKIGDTSSHCLHHNS